MKTSNRIFWSLSWICATTIVFNAHSAPLMTMGGTNMVGVYAIEDLSAPGDTWNANNSGYTASDYTGYYIGTVINDNNDSPFDLTTIFSYYLDTPTSSFSLAKIDRPATTGTGIEMAYDPGGKSGNWATTDNQGVNFYSVKAGPGYALYYVNPSMMSGDWVTRHLEVGMSLKTPSISHINVSLTDPDEPIPPGKVPEPATILLFSTGMVGLVVVQQKIKK